MEGLRKPEGREAEQMLLATIKAEEGGDSMTDQQTLWIYLEVTSNTSLSCINVGPGSSSSVPQACTAKFPIH